MKSLPWLSCTRVFKSYRRSSFTLLAGVLGSLCPATLPAQTLTFTGTKPYVDFGANLCRPGESTPAPCSQTLTLNYKVTKGGTLGTPKVLTLGSPDLDFTLANGSTCIGGVTTGETCAVNLKFKPRYAGGVSGAVQVTSETGTVLVTTPVLGNGTGPQIGTLTNGVIAGGLSGSLPQQPAAEVVLDGAGDIFGINSFCSPYTLTEQPANGGPQMTIPFTYSDGIALTAQAMAIDGAGNILFIGNTTIGVITPAGGAAVPLPFPPLSPGIWEVAIDGIGDVFVIDVANSQVLKLPAGCHSSACVVTVLQIPGGVGDIVGIAADPAGDLFVTNDTTVTEYPAGGGSPLTPATNFSPRLIDGVGDFFAAVETGDYNSGTASTNLLELPAGTTAPVTLIPNVSDPYNCNVISLALDLASDAFATYYCSYEYPVQTPELVEYRPSQFSSLNFGSLPVGSSATLPLGVTNTGNRTLVLSPYFRSPSYKILSTTPSGCEAATAPGHTCTLNIQFTALSAGDHTIALTLGGNVAADKVLLLQGIGTK